MRKTAAQIVIGAQEKRHPFWLRIEVGHESECWPWKGPVDKDGYGYIGKDRAHRLTWDRTHKTLSDGQVIRHTCDHPNCCNPDHLVSGTNYDNVMDRVDRGRSAKGTRNGRALLTNAKVLKIFQSKGSYSEISLQFGISKWTVRDIKTGKTWGWLTT